MSMLNSRSIKHVIGEQVAGAPIVKMLGLEPISMGYIIVAPGMKVGEVGQAEVVKRDDEGRLRLRLGGGVHGHAIGLSGSGQRGARAGAIGDGDLGEAGHLSAIGGRWRHPQRGAGLASEKAGADIIVTGTIVENCDPVCLAEIIKAIKT